jgi:hypothetical protein
VAGSLDFPLEISSIPGVATAVERRSICERHALPAGVFNASRPQGPYRGLAVNMLKQVWCTKLPALLPVSALCQTREPNAQAEQGLDSVGQALGDALLNQNWPRGACRSATW